MYIHVLWSRFWLNMSLLGKCVCVPLWSFEMCHEKQVRNTVNEFAGKIIYYHKAYCSLEWPCWTSVWCIHWYFLTVNVRGPSYLGLGQYLGCWCLSSLRRQDISSHDIDFVEYVSPGLTWERILCTCAMSMWSNDIKCKYMFMFPLKKLARKGLIFHARPKLTRFKQL